MNRNENEAESFAGNFMAFGEEALFFEVPCYSPREHLKCRTRRCLPWEQRVASQAVRRCLAIETCANA